jgi:hypothetical protein
VRAGAADVRTGAAEVAGVSVNERSRGASSSNKPNDESKESFSRTPDANGSIKSSAAEVPERDEILDAESGEGGRSGFWLIRSG